MKMPMNNKKKNVNLVEEIEEAKTSTSGAYMAFVHDKIAKSLWKEHG